FLNFVTYALRPIYDSQTVSVNVIKHIHSPGLPQSDLAACQRHGWDIWTGKKRKLVDAVIFSIELDLLEIRLAELYPVTSQFFILESTTTFTGLSKPLVLEPLLHPNATDQRFRPYLDKIRYRGVRGRKLLRGEDPFNIEKEMRWLMGDWIASHDAGLEDGDLVLMSDVDEIPSRTALALLTSCSIPTSIHLQLSQHLYSFNFSLSPLLPSLRAKLVTYHPNQTPYTHTLPSSQTPVLTDAGWHCSFCFPNLSDFHFKSRAYSHTDRLGSTASSARVWLDAERIKKVVCKGEDLFGMLPEAYDWSGLFARWNGAGEWLGGELPWLLAQSAGMEGEARWGWLLGRTEKERCERTWEVGEKWKLTSKV
ncbi:hypothetical protein FRB90_011426, partial [Tulasnella sp. 427]